MAIEAPSWLALWAEGELEIDDKVVAALRLTSGRVVACDPLVGLRSAEPLERQVPPGSYPVVLGRAEGDVVLACLRIAEGRVAAWELARPAGDEEGDGLQGYGVDSGTGCFADGDAAARGGDLGDGLLEAVRRQGFAALSIAPGGKDELVAFVSGAGDGVYASWWALDEAGQPLFLVTDFGLIEVDDEVEEEDPLEDDGPLGEEQLRGLLAELAEDGEDAPPPEPPRAPVSPVFLRVRALIDRWEEAGKMELADGCDREGLAEALLEVLAKLEGHRRVGAHLAEWLIERPEVEDLFASDAELEADLRG